MNPSPMTTAERELTDAECDAIAIAAHGQIWKSETIVGANMWDRALIRAGWQARAGAVPREPVAWHVNRGLIVKWGATKPDFGAGPWEALYAAPSPPGPSDEANQGAQPVAWHDVQAERERQVSKEGWTPEHDDEHRGELQIAAACLCVDGTDAEVVYEGERADWWGLAAKHHGNWRRQLVIAGALILAAIEKLDRAAAPVSREGLGDG